MRLHLLGTTLSTNPNYQTKRSERLFFCCRQYGTRESKEVTVEGRVQFDLFQVTLYLACSPANIFFHVYYNLLKVYLSSCIFFIRTGYAKGL